MATPNSYKDPYWRTIANQAEEKHGVPAGLLNAVFTHGEKSNNDQVSSAGAKTPFQIIPSTRDAFLKKYGIDAYLSPENAAEVGALHLKESLNRNAGNVSAAVSEYIGGPNRANWGPVTQAYTNRVMVNMAKTGTAPASGAVRSFKAELDAQSAPAKPSIANVYSAYQGGQMSPEEAQVFEIAVKEGKVLLPTGASLKTTESPQQTALPAAAIAAYHSGNMPAEERAVIDRAIAGGQLAPLPPKPAEPTLGQKIGDVFTGNLRATDETRSLPEWTTMPELNELSGAGFKAGLGTLLAPTAEIPQIIKAQYPGTQVRQDAKGNSILRSSVDGKEYAIPPGITMGDLPRILSGVAAFSPAGSIATSLPKLAAASAGTQAVIEGTQAATGGEFNPSEVALAGAGVPVAALVAKGVGAAGSAVKNVLTKATTGKPVTAAAEMTAGQPAVATPVAQGAPVSPEETISFGVITKTDSRIAAGQEEELAALAEISARKIGKDEYYGPSASYKYAQNKEGKVTSRKFVKVVTPDSSSLVGFVDKNGAFYVGAGSKTTPLRLALPDEISAARKTLETEYSTARETLKRERNKFDVEIEGLADSASKSGLDVRIVYPDDTSSRYIYATRADGEALKIRIADHPQPIEGGKVVGGFDKKLGVRHSPSDLSLDPYSGKSMDDALAHLEGFAGELKNVSQKTTRPLINQPEPGTQKTAEELASLAKSAVTGMTGKTKATQELAEQAAPNAATVQAAKDLKIELDPDFVTSNDQFRKLVGLARSQAGSDAEARGISVVAKASDRAEEVLKEIGANRDMAGVSDKIKASLSSARDGMEKASDALYKEIDAVIPGSAQVDLPALRGHIEKLTENLGKDGLSAQEKALAKMLDGNVTYARLARERGLIGKAMAGKESPYGNMEEGALKQLYKALAGDQLDAVTSIGGEALRDKYRLASQTVAQRKALEKRIVQAFGRDVEGSLVPALRNSINAATRGDDKGLTRLIKTIPEPLRAEAMSSALLAHATSSTKGGQFGFAQYAKMYQGMRNNAPVYAAVVKSLGGEADKVLTDLYQVSQSVAKAQASVLHTGKANQGMKDAFKGAESLVGQILEHAGRAAARGAATEAATTMAVGPTGAGFLAGALQAVRGGNKDALRAAGDLMTSQEFKDLVSASARSQPTQKQVARVSRSRQMHRFSKHLSQELRRDVAARDRWINAVMQQPLQTNKQIEGQGQSL